MGRISLSLSFSLFLATRQSYRYKRPTARSNCYRSSVWLVSSQDRLNASEHGAGSPEAAVPQSQGVASRGLAARAGIPSLARAMALSVVGGDAARKQDTGYASVR